jgi:hypothetical protein
MRLVNIVLVIRAGNGDLIYDTSHGNRMPYMPVDVYAAGMKIDKTHLSGLSNLLTRVIWDQSLSSPSFTNYISGDNSDFAGRPAWGNGLIYAGWITLGRCPAGLSSCPVRPTLGMPAFVPADERSGGRHQARRDEDGRRD